MKTVVILSMPRSGSSLLAGILHHLGVWMGEEKDLKSGKHLNKYGCFENRSFISMNENLLFQCKLLIDQSRRVYDHQEMMKRAVKKYELWIKKIIRDNERSLWGFKNPNIIYSLPYFHHLLRNPYYIRLNRSVNSIANSFQKTANPQNWWPLVRDEFSYFSFHHRLLLVSRFIKLLLSQGNFSTQQVQEKIINNGYKRIDHFLKDKRHLSLHLNHLLNDPYSNIQKIINFLKISPSPSQIQNSLNFINPNLISS